jgi:hypothetical protein
MAIGVFGNFKQRMHSIRKVENRVAAAQTGNSSSRGRFDRANRGPSRLSHIPLARMSRPRTAVPVGTSKSQAACTRLSRVASP